MKKLLILFLLVILIINGCSDFIPEEGNEDPRQTEAADMGDIVNAVKTNAPIVVTGIPTSARPDETDVPEEVPSKPALTEVTGIIATPRSNRLVLPKAEEPLDYSGMARADCMVKNTACPTSLDNLETKGGTIAIYDRNAKQVLIYKTIKKECSQIEGTLPELVFASPDGFKIAFQVKKSVYIHDLENGRTYTAYEGGKRQEDLMFKGWLDNVTLTFRPYNVEKPLPLKVVELINKSTESIEPTLPGLHILDNWTFPNDTRLLPDSTSRFIAYPIADGNQGLGVGIWDKQQLKVINEFYRVDWNQGMTKWAPTQLKLGAITYLTRFAQLGVDGDITLSDSMIDYFGEGQGLVFDWSWSHDSSSVAMWLGKTMKNEKTFMWDLKRMHLVVLRLEGNEVIDFGQMTTYQAFVGDPTYTPAPIWSRDNKFLLVETIWEENQSKLVIISTDTMEKWEVGSNMYPIAWLR